MTENELVKEFITNFNPIKNENNFLLNGERKYYIGQRYEDLFAPDNLGSDHEFLVSIQQTIVNDIHFFVGIAYQYLKARNEILSYFWKMLSSVRLHYEYNDDISRLRNIINIYINEYNGHKIRLKENGVALFVPICNEEPFSVQWISRFHSNNIIGFLQHISNKMKLKDEQYNVLLAHPDPIVQACARFVLTHKDHTFISISTSMLQHRCSTYEEDFLDL